MSSRIEDLEARIEELEEGEEYLEAECKRLRGVIREAAEILSAALSEKVEG